MDNHDRLWRLIDQLGPIAALGGSLVLGATLAIWIWRGGP